MTLYYSLSRLRTTPVNHFKPFMVIVKTNFNAFNNFPYCIFSIFTTRIEWDGDNLYYLFNPSAHAGEPGTEKILVKVKESDWEKFHDSLYKIGVWNWEERYENPEILDGTSWGFEAVYSDKSIKSSGSNSFPKRFNSLLEAISKLTNGLSFN